MRPQLGQPIELPWWTVPAALPPALCLLGAAVVPAPAGARVVDAVASLLMLVCVAAVARRVRSRNLQSVYLSAAYAFWFFAVLIWVTLAAVR